MVINFGVLLVSRRSVTWAPPHPTPPLELPILSTTSKVSTWIAFRLTFTYNPWFFASGSTPPPPPPQPHNTHPEKSVFAHTHTGSKADCLLTNQAFMHWRWKSITKNIVCKWMVLFRDVHIYIHTYNLYTYMRVNPGLLGMCRTHWLSLRMLQKQRWTSLLTWMISRLGFLASTYTVCILALLSIICTCTDGPILQVRKNNCNHRAWVQLKTATNPNYHPDPRCMLDRVKLQTFRRCET